MNRTNLPLRYKSIVDIAVKEAVKKALDDAKKLFIDSLTNGNKTIFEEQFSGMVKKNLESLNKETSEKFDKVKRDIDASINKMEESIEDQKLMKEYQEKLEKDVNALRGNLNKVAEDSKRDIKSTGEILKKEVNEISENVTKSLKESSTMVQKSIQELSKETQKNIDNKSKETENSMKKILDQHQRTEADFKNYVADKIDHIEKMEEKISNLKKDLEEAKNELRKMNDAYSAVIHQFSELHLKFNKPKRRGLFSRRRGVGTSAGTSSVSPSAPNDSDSDSESDKKEDYTLPPKEPEPKEQEFVSEQNNVQSNEIEASAPPIYSDLPSYNEVKKNKKGKEKVYAV